MLKKWLRRWLGIEDGNANRNASLRCEDRHVNELFRGATQSQISSIRRRYDSALDFLGVEWYEQPAQSGWRKKKGGK